MNLALWPLKPIPIGTESWLVFAVVLIALVVFIWLISRLVTHATEDSDPTEVDRQMLTTINDLHRKGDLSQKEFRSINGQLVARLHDDRKSSAAGSSDKKDFEGLTRLMVRTPASSLNETHESIAQTVSRAEFPTTTESLDSKETGLK